MLHWRTSFVLGGLALLSAQCAVILAAPSAGHGYETKSFAQAYLECLQYLNISRQSLYHYDSAAVPLNSGGNCLLRCIGLNTRWWNDETGLNEKALVRFFRQADGESLEQARTCVAQLTKPADTCAAAYQTFRCYGNALGEVIAHAEYVAPCRQEIRRAVSDCAKMLQVSDEQLESCVASETFLHDESASALLRCVVLRLGLYTDTTGVLCDRVQLLMDEDTAELWTEARVQEAKRCEENLRELGADSCVLAAHAVEICYGRLAFGELWQVLREEYGSSDTVFQRDQGEPLSTTTEKELVVQEYALDDKLKEEKEEFHYPSSPRFRGLVIVAPELYAVDALVEDGSELSQVLSSQMSEESSSLEQMSQNGNQKPLERLDEDATQSTTEEASTASTPQETSKKPQETSEKDPEASHTIQKRLAVPPVASDQPLYDSSGIRKQIIGF
uniref:Uncharacterized protein n=1 Tax=Anopheles epiroticus TaxID=199890 RepID=A0A182PQ64_9DIPT